MRYLGLVVLLFGVVAQAETTVTLYQGGFAFVEEERDIQLVDGAVAVVPGLPATIIPGSLSIEGVDASSWMLERPAVGLESLIGKEVVVGYRGGTARGVLLSLQGGILLKTEQGYLLIPSYDSVLSPEKPATSELPVLKIFLAAAPEGGKVRLRYLLKGLSWEANYVGVYSQGQLVLRGMALLRNRCGVDFRGAKVHLVAGEVFGPQGKAWDLKATKALAAQAPEVSPLAAYHRYVLPGTVDLPQGEVAVEYLPDASVEAEEVYRFSQGRVLFILRFVNTTGLPLPAGTVQVYGEGAFLGEARIGHTPKGEQVELPLGVAFDLVGERVQTEYTRLGKDRYRESYRITIRSAKEKAVTVEVIEQLPGQWRITSSTLPYEVLDAHRVLFRVPVEAGGEGKVEYTVEYTG